ncbi:serine/threonine-protein kinase [Allostreptomyces psammosilenae]|uniref:non-specific serine/threonine protein kinase n=1 Tax=Allostreptomyces psammosilenae TaxID=1892865 RepID=A0A852ZL79_9ACTN|nr:protein kinase [Allostreptomyces psammosilenae]NYI03163.1 outer membrane protein assembly factor BamB/predicted Ser/Thr protein kinase [Allostreptomyces psammosilenae]
MPGPDDQQWPAPPGAPSPDPAARTVAGRYRLGRRLGAGGMGTVWEGEDTVLGRRVALKELLESPNLPEQRRMVQRERMLREARTAGAVPHPNVVAVYDVVVEHDQPWIVMELVEGTTLSDILRRGTLSPRQTARLGLQVLDALTAVHEAGVLHRDVKPSNILLDDRGRIVLTDFGIAQADDDAALTEAGGIVGSLAYVPPERLHGRPPEAAGDLWALGVVLLESLTGRCPFAREGTGATLHAVLTHQPEIPSDGDGGPHLAEAIAALLEKEPERRLGARPLRQRLLAIASGQVPPPLPDPASRAAGAPAPGLPGPHGVSPERTTQTMHGERASVVAPGGSTGTPPAPSHGYPDAGGARPRRGRSRALLAACAGALAVVLVGGGVWAVVSGDDGGTGPGGDASASASAPSGGSGDATPAGDSLRRVWPAADAEPLPVDQEAAPAEVMGAWTAGDLAVRVDRLGVTARSVTDGAEAWRMSPPQAGLAPCAASASTTSSGQAVVAWGTERFGEAPESCRLVTLVDLVTGRAQWQRELTDAGAGASLEMGLTDSAVVLNGSSVEALAVADGEPLWKYPQEAGTCAAGFMATSAEGVLLVYHCTGVPSQLQYLAADSGVVQWKTDLPGHGEAVVVSADPNVVWQTDAEGNGSLVTYDGLGRPIGEVKDADTDGGMDSTAAFTPVPDNQTMLYGDLLVAVLQKDDYNGGLLLAVDTTTGQRAWEYPLDVRYSNLLLAGDADAVPLLQVDGLLMEESRLVYLDAGSGQERATPSVEFPQDNTGRVSGTGLMADGGRVVYLPDWSGADQERAMEIFAAP